jgi:hypothetical protein
MATSWLTSDDLIAAIKRKISFPLSQRTFSENDVLLFANEEMMISQVPSVLSFHEEYYVMTVKVPMRSNVNRYAIPDRAIGMKLRNIFWLDSEDNYYEMTRVQSEDKAFFSYNSGNNTAIQKFYLENNDVVLCPKVGENPSGALQMEFFVRPNQLVKNERAAIISAFASKMILSNADISPGDTVSIGGVTFIADTDFAIGASSTETATNLVTVINTNGIVSASNGSPSTGTVTATFSNFDYVFTTSNTTGFAVDANKSIQFSSVPTHIEDGQLVDFLQTKGGHKIRAYDIAIPSNGISGLIIDFDADDVPSDLLVGDYICSSNECIIPFLPDDLHTGLADRTCARILSAIGDQEGLASQNAKIQENEMRQATLLDNRVEGTPQKVLANGTFLRYGKMGTRRRT